ncbi:unnamed protein product [Blepharisma stoltei]|uniref:RCC1-like domain-containing protein n=1 Tax=Blepharisma stoltei TaxID=1481888 RepID=A0AAU9JMA8_9CILI|nr:unnamed protein product [Blepharisma stoltei]
METQSLRSSEISTDSPSVYQLIKSQEYSGLTPISPFLSKFSSFTNDALYRYPILDAEYLTSTDSNHRALLLTNKLTFADRINIKKNLEVLSSSSPFSKGSEDSHGISTQESQINQVPVNSIEISRSINISVSSKISNSEEFLGRNSLNFRFFESSQTNPETDQEIEKPVIDNADKEMILQIQRNFHAKANDERFYQSITPASSYNSIISKSNLRLTPRGSTNEVIAEKTSGESDIFQEKLQDTSDIEWEPNMLNDFKKNFELMPYDRLSESFGDEKINEDSIMSLAEEGTAHPLQVYCSSPSASKNIMIARHFKPALIKLEPKVLASFAISISSWSEISSDSFAAITGCNPYSPIMRKIAICTQANNFEDQTGYSALLELLASVCCSGFNSALQLEYSNIDAQNKAIANNSSFRPSLLSEKVLQSIARSSVSWLSCGYEHCVLVTNEGKVMTWGYGASGCLGHGNLHSHSFPRQVKALARESVVYLECGGYHTVAVTNNGSVYSWGRGDVYQLGIPFRELCKDETGYVSLVPLKINYFSERNITIKAIACGEAHTLALDTNGKVFAFGWGEDGQLGISRDELTNQSMSKEITLISALDSLNIVKISAGSIFSACLTETGQILVWGNGEQGQLGQGSSETSSDHPIRVETLKEEVIIDVICGENHVLALSDSAKLFGWGLGKAGMFSSSLEQKFSAGTGLVCFKPKCLSEADINQHFVVDSDYSAPLLIPKKNEQSLLSAVAEKLQKLQLA